MAETIMMIHGMWGGGWYWENYRKYFEAKGFSCLIPTLPFHNMDPMNAPDPHLGKMGLLEYAATLEKQIKNPEDPPVLIGHSMGGLLAQILGSRGLAKALILLTPASPYGINALKISVLKSFWDVMMWHKVVPRPFFWKKPMRISFDKAVYSMLHLVPADQQKKIYKKFVYESGRAAFQIGFWLFDGKKASRVDENKIKCPVLVISGKEDRITPALVVRHVAEKYKAVSNYKEFQGHAHWVVGEPGWEEIAEYCFKWLSQIK